MWDLSEVARAHPVDLSALASAEGPSHPSNRRHCISDEGICQFPEGPPALPGAGAPLWVPRFSAAGIKRDSAKEAPSQGTVHSTLKLSPSSDSPASATRTLELSPPTMYAKRTSSPEVSTSPGSEGHVMTDFDVKLLKHKLNKCNMKQLGVLLAMYGWNRTAKWKETLVDRCVAAGVGLDEADAARTYKEPRPQPRPVASPQAWIDPKNGGHSDVREAPVEEQPVENGGHSDVLNKVPVEGEAPVAEHPVEGNPDKEEPPQESLCFAGKAKHLEKLEPVEKLILYV